MTRNPSIDITKGILMCAVIWGHLGYHSNRLLEQSHAISNYYAHLEVSNWLYQPYYMCAFFLISGIFDHTNTLRDIWKSAKSLFTICIIVSFFTKVIPQCISGEPSNIITIIFMSFSWFIVSLFWIKVISFLFNKTLKYTETKTLSKSSNLIANILCGALHVGGLCLITNKCSFAFIGEGMFFFIYYYLGRHYNILKSIKFCHLLCIYIGSIIICNLLGNLPNLQGNLTETYSQIPFGFLMGLSGSLLLLNITKRFGRNKLLELIGQRSLILCILASPIQCLFIKKFGSFFNETLISEGYIAECFWLAITFVVPIAIILLACEILDRKYLRWILGKW